MGWSFAIGRVLGSELRIHVTFLLLLGWIAYAAYATAGPQAAAWNTLFIILLFVCVVMHEFGHALMARRFGVKTPRVTLLPIGGLAELDRMPEKPSEEIAVALAGPAVTLAIVIVLVALGARFSLADLTSMPSHYDLKSLVGELAFANLYLFLFNLIPAFPMDGGRVLRAALAWRMGRVQGTAWAANVGRVFAILFGVAGFYLASPILVLIAVFVYFAASSESAGVAMQAATVERRAVEAMISEFRALSPDDTLADASDAILQTTQHEFPVVDRGGRAVGFLTRQAVFAAVTQGRTEAPVSELMATDTARVAPGDPLDKALEKLNHDPSGAVLVERPDGRLMGYITRENLGELMVLARGGLTRRGPWG